MKIKKICKTCKWVFYVWPYRKDTARFCSYRCLRVPKIKKICKTCKAVFFVYPCYKNTAKFCSNDCSHASRIGVATWNKGLTKDDPRVAEYSRKSGLAQRGKKHSREAKEKMSLARKRRKPSELTIRRSTEARRGKPLSKEHREKLTKIRKEKYKNGFINPFQGRKHSEKTKKLQSERRKSLLKSHPEILRKTLITRVPNKSEIFLGDLIRDEDLPYRFVGNGEFIIAGKNPDFININGEKQIIELAGEAWHSKEEMQDKVELYRDYGFETLIIWHTELRKPEAVRAKLKGFANEISSERL